MSRLRIGAAALALYAAAQPVASQNSTRKIRSAPSAVAARAGSAVAWRASLDAALAESAESRKPVFWYVPTIAGSRMDRKPEIDRYMLAGPFSWPKTIELLNRSFVPVRQAAGLAEEKRFGLRTVEFIEPGYVVLDGDGAERARLDEITTFHPSWFLRPLAALVGAEVGPAGDFPGKLDAEAAALLYGGPRLDPPREVGAEQLAKFPAELRAEGRYLIGAGLFHAGREDEAFAVWRQLAADAPEHPLAWKAAMEAERHGPLVRGFETYEPLVPGAFAASGDGTRAKAGTYDEDAVWRLGTEYLLRMQRSGGGFDDSTYDFGGTDGLPNVYAAVTAICTIALLERAATVEDARFEAALERAFGHLTRDDSINRQDQDELVWAHAYRIRAFCRWLELRPGDAARVRPALARSVRDLVAMQPESGAWFHEYANPFVIGCCLVALKDAERHDVEIPNADRVLGRGVRALLRCRAKNGAFSYGYPRRGEARAQLEGGVGRIPLGELALSLWGEGEEGALARSVGLSFEYYEHLAAVRKYDDHASAYGYGGFFFWFDLHARTEAILALDPGEERDALIARQRATILALPEFDGCFVDSHELGRCYGTGMALWCLAALRRG